MRLDATRMTALQRCPFYYFTKYEEGWEPEITKVALTFGSAVHTSLMTVYKGGTVEEALKVWDTFTPTENEQVRTQEKGRTVISDYFKRFDPKEFEVLAVEKEFEVPIGNDTYFGRRDADVKWGGLIWVLEHKTSRSLGLSFSEQFRPHNQTNGYCHSCKVEYGECAGMIVNGMRVAKTKPKDEGGNFARVPVSPAPKEIEDWQRSFQYACAGIEGARQAKYWDKTQGNCFTYYSKCDLYNICLYGDYSGFKKEEK